MRKVYIILILILLGGLFFAYAGSKKDQSVTSKVTALELGVSIVREGKEKIVLDTNNASLGDVVKTNETGIALVEGNHSTYLEPLSSLVIKENSSSGNIFALESGKLWARTRKVLEKGEFYEIETNNARAAVRGTSFGVLLSGGSTIIFVTEGEVEVVKKDSEGNILSNTSIILKSGEKAVVTDDGITKGPIGSEDTDIWFLKHNPEWKTKQEEVKKVEVPKIVPTSSEVKDVSSVEPKVVPQEQPPKFEEPISLLSLQSVVPEEVPFTQNSFLITLNGKGFLKARAVVVGKVSIPQFAILSDSKIQFDITQNDIPPGLYDVSVVNISNVITIKSQSLRILDQPVDTGKLR